LKVLILAGGYGTRLAEETMSKPKPMIEVASKPILWHIMAHYATHGFKDFIVLGGYKREYINNYFLNYSLMNNEITIELKTGKITSLSQEPLDWKITVLDTGRDANTGSRIRNAIKLIDDDFLLTYGDGISDVNLTELVQFHKSSGKLATLTAVQPPARFGALRLEEASSTVLSFHEKPLGEESWVNGGFFVLSKDIFSQIEGENPNFESDILPTLALQKNLAAFKHYGYWQPADTLRDIKKLDSDLTQMDFKWLQPRK
jgi:glucose-1-phosphate cytidylyltransferase